MSAPPSQVNQSLGRSLSCLYAVVTAGRPVGSRQVAKLVGDEHTRVNRMLGTLRHLGLAAQTQDRKYVPGPGLHVLSAMSLRGSPLLRCALPHLRELARQTGDAVALGVLWRRHVCYLYFGGPDDPTEAALSGKNLFPAELSSIGRILLAQQPAKAVGALFTAKPPQVMSGVSELMKILAAARHAGYALQHDGPSVAVAIDSEGTAGLALVRLASGLTPAQAGLLLRESADRISAALATATAAAVRTNTSEEKEDLDDFAIV